MALICGSLLIEDESPLERSYRRYGRIRLVHEITGIEREYGLNRFFRGIAESIFKPSDRKSGIVLIVRNKRIPGDDRNVKRKIVVMQIEPGKGEPCREASLIETGQSPCSSADTHSPVQTAVFLIFGNIGFKHLGSVFDTLDTDSSKRTRLMEKIGDMMKRDVRYRTGPLEADHSRSDTSDRKRDMIHVMPLIDTVEFPGSSRFKRDGKHTQPKEQFQVSVHNDCLSLVGKKEY